MNAVVVWLKGELPLWRKDAESVANWKCKGEWCECATTNESEVEFIAAR